MKKTKEILMVLSVVSLMFFIPAILVGTEVLSSETVWGIIALELILLLSCPIILFVRSLFPAKHNSKKRTHFSSAHNTDEKYIRWENKIKTAADWINWADHAIPNLLNDPEKEEITLTCLDQIKIIREKSCWEEHQYYFSRNSGKFHIRIYHYDAANAASCRIYADDTLTRYDVFDQLERIIQKTLLNTDPDDVKKLEEAIDRISLFLLQLSATPEKNTETKDDHRNSYEQDLPPETENSAREITDSSSWDDKKVITLEEPEE